jgi:hypothetical protein
VIIPDSLFPGVGAVNTDWLLKRQGLQPSNATAATDFAFQQSSTARQISRIVSAAFCTQVCDRLARAPKVSDASTKPGQGKTVNHHYQI